MLARPLLPNQPGEAAATPIQPNTQTYCIIDLTFSPLRTEVCRYKYFLFLIVLMRRKVITKKYAVHENIPACTPRTVAQRSKAKRNVAASFK